MRKGSSQRHPHRTARHRSGSLPVTLVSRLQRLAGRGRINGERVAMGERRRVSAKHIGDRQIAALLHAAGHPRLDVLPGGAGTTKAASLDVIRCAWSGGARERRTDLMKMPLAVLLIGSNSSSVRSDR